MISKLLLPLLCLIGAATAQNTVTVPSNDSSVVVTQDGQVLSPTYLLNPDFLAAGLFTECGGTLVLNNTIDSTASLTFEGTAISVTFITCNTGGQAALYIDGTFWENVNTYSDQDVTLCTIGTATDVNLAPTSHTISIVNLTPTNRTHIQKFEYTPSGNAPPTTQPATPTTPAQNGSGNSSGNQSANTSTPKKHSSTGAIVGGIVGGIIVLIVAIVLIIYVKKRDNAPTTTTNNIQPSAWQRPGPVGGFDSVNGQGFEPKDYNTSYHPVAAPYNTPGPSPGPFAPPPGPPPMGAGPTQYPSPYPSPPIPMPAPFIPPSESQHDRRNSFAAESTYSSPNTHTNSQSAQPSTPTILRTIANPTTPQPTLNPGGLRPLPDAPSPAYTESVGSGSDLQPGGGSGLSQHRASGLDMVQQLLNRGVPAAEITSVIRMMNEGGGAGPSVGGFVPREESGSPPPPVYGDEKAGLKGL